MNILIYDTLPDEAAEIRRAVFVEEQGFHNEFDEIDKRAKHIVLYDNNAPWAGFFKIHFAVLFITILFVEFNSPGLCV